MSETHSSKVAITVALIGLFGTLGAVILNKYLPETISFRRAASSTMPVVEDPEGNRYPTVQLVGKRWLAQNLNYYVTGSACFDADPDNCRKYGKLYNWESAQTACAALGVGWRVPTVDEWKELALFYGGYAYGYPEAYERKIGNPEKTGHALGKGGDSGFEVPRIGGWGGGSGNWHNFDDLSEYWSNSEKNQGYAWAIKFYNHSNYFVSFNDGSKDYLHSCRCIQDLE
jgi:uncharacterized protein (TIGR02145 family)